MRPARSVRDLLHAHALMHMHIFTYACVIHMRIHTLMHFLTPLHAHAWLMCTHTAPCHSEWPQELP
jgi:hypothetical protein